MSNDTSCYVVVVINAVGMAAAAAAASNVSTHSCVEESRAVINPLNARLKRHGSPSSVKGQTGAIFLQEIGKVSFHSPI